MTDRDRRLRQLLEMSTVALLAGNILEAERLTLLAAKLPDDD